MGTRSTSEAIPLLPPISFWFQKKHSDAIMSYFDSQWNIVTPTTLLLWFQKKHSDSKVSNFDSPLNIVSYLYWELDISVLIMYQGFYHALNDFINELLWFSMEYDFLIILGIGYFSADVVLVFLS